MINHASKNVLSNRFFVEMGDRYAQKGQWQDAHNSYRDAIYCPVQETVLDGHLHAKLGRVLIKLGQLERAQQSYRTSYQRSGGNLNLMYGSVEARIGILEAMRIRPFAPIKQFEPVPNGVPAVDPVPEETRLVDTLEMWPGEENTEPIPASKLLGNRELGGYQFFGWLPGSETDWPEVEIPKRLRVSFAYVKLDHAVCEGFRRFGQLISSLHSREHPGPG